MMGKGLSQHLVTAWPSPRTIAAAQTQVVRHFQTLCRRHITSVKCPESGKKVLP